MDNIHLNKPQWAQKLSHSEYVYLINTITSNLNLANAEFTISKFGSLDIKFKTGESVLVILERWVNIYQKYGRNYFPRFVKSFIQVTENINNPNFKL